MINLVEKIKQGEDYFGTGGHNTPTFDKFFLLFNKTFQKEMRKIRGFSSYRATKGHFYISGFFMVYGHVYYFAISDVRHGIGKPNEILIRTAKNFHDYSGGANNFIDLIGLADNVKRVFNLD